MLDINDLFRRFFSYCSIFIFIPVHITPMGVDFRFAKERTSSGVYSFTYLYTIS